MPRRQPLPLPPPPLQRLWLIRLATHLQATRRQRRLRAILRRNRRLVIQHLRSRKKASRRLLRSPRSTS